MSTEQSSDAGLITRENTRLEVGEEGDPFIVIGNQRIRLRTIIRDELGDHGERVHAEINSDMPDNGPWFTLSPEDEQFPVVDIQPEVEYDE